MDVNDHRPFAGELRRRLIQEGGNGTVVPRLPVDQLRFGKPRSVQAAGLAESPTLQLAVSHVEGISIVILGSGAERKCQFAAVVAPIEAIQNPDRNLGHRNFFVVPGLEHVQYADSVLVGFEGNPAPVFGKIEFVYIPVERGSEHCDFAAAQIHVDQTLKFGVLIAGHVHAFSIFGKSRVAIGYGFSRLRSQQVFLARSYIHQPNVTLCR